MVHAGPSLGVLLFIPMRYLDQRILSAVVDAGFPIDDGAGEPAPAGRSAHLDAEDVETMRRTLLRLRTITDPSP